MLFSIHNRYTDIPNKQKAIIIDVILNILVSLVDNFLFSFSIGDNLTITIIEITIKIKKNIDKDLIIKKRINNKETIIKTMELIKQQKKLRACIPPENFRKIRNAMRKATHSLTIINTTPINIEAMILIQA